MPGDMMQIAARHEPREAGAGDEGEQVGIGEMHHDGGGCQQPDRGGGSRAPKCHRQEERDEAAEEFVVHGPQHRIVHVRLAEECEQRTFQHGAEQ